MNLLDHLSEAVRSHNLLPAGTRLVVGVSGGTDSLALMHLLAALRQRLDFSIHVATLDHGLRGAAGADDARFVADTALAWGLEVTLGSIDVAALATENRTSTEAAARHARYDFLALVAREHDADRVAVAHHADDQVETILLHLLRGSGLSGLTGMSRSAPLPGHPDLTLIRPLLDVTHAELSAYCRQHNLLSRHDATNDDLTLLRNRLRRETIPYLRELSPQIERRMLQLGEIATLEGDFADSALHDAVQPHVTRAERRINLPRRVFAGLHPALQRRFVVWAAQQLGASQDVGYIHVTAAVELALNGQVGALAQLKGGVHLRIGYGMIFVEHESEPMSGDFPLLSAGVELPLAVPGETPISTDWLLRVSLNSEPDAAPVSVPDGGEIRLRARRMGDRFAPQGLNGGSKKLNEWLIDRKVPRHLRDHLPLLVVGESIAAVWWQTWHLAFNSPEASPSNRVIYVSLNKTYDGLDLKT